MTSPSTSLTFFGKKPRSSIRPHPKRKFSLRVTAKAEDVEVTNGFKTASAISNSLPGTIFIRVWNNISERAFEGTLHNSPDGFEAENLPSECADPNGLAEWMIHEIFEP